jgi:putative endonuclease
MCGRRLFHDVHMAHKDVLGQWGESVAAEYLVTEGYRVIDRRWRCARGEIDLIAQREGLLAFVEVKTRRTLKFGHPLEAITPAKFSRLRILAGEWCRSVSHTTGLIRIDAIGIVGDGVSVQSLDHRVGVIA